MTSQFVDRLASRSAVVSMNALIWSLVGFVLFVISFHWDLSVRHDGESLLKHFDWVTTGIPVAAILTLWWGARRLAHRHPTWALLTRLLRDEFASLALNTGSFLVAAGAAQINHVSNLPLVIGGFVLWFVFAALTWK